jgi:hypothetical protein
LAYISSDAAIAASYHGVLTDLSFQRHMDVQIFGIKKNADT